MWRRMLAVLFAVALIAAGCGDDDGDEGGAGETTATTAADESTETTSAETTDAGGGDSGGAAAELQLASSDEGEILVDAGGNTVYLFVPDAQGESTCYDDCEANWPVVGEVTTLGEGLDDALLGTTERTNGDVQATYNGWPLYYFANDAAPGDVNGQGVNEVWYVLDAQGNAVGAG